MAGRKKRLYCENEIEHVLEDSLSEGSDVSSESEVLGFESESVTVKVKVKVLLTAKVKIMQRNIRNRMTKQFHLRHKE
jgi:hypothetical protein